MVGSKIVFLRPAARAGVECGTIIAKSQQSRQWLSREICCRADVDLNVLTREDDVLFCPGMDLLAMRAGHFSALDFCVRPQFFFDRLTARRQFCRRWATDEKAFDDRSFRFRRGRWCKKVHNNKYWLAEPINDTRFIDIVR